MFDTDGNGVIDFNEFAGLWQYVCDWQDTFRSFDLDNSGTIDKGELKAGTYGWLSVRRIHPRLLICCTVFNYCTCAHLSSIPRDFTRGTTSYHQKDDTSGIFIQTILKVCEISTS
jgi:hypothetical protein